MLPAPIAADVKADRSIAIFVYSCGSYQLSLGLSPTDVCREEIARPGRPTSQNSSRDSYVAGIGDVAKDDGTVSISDSNTLNSHGVCCQCYGRSRKAETIHCRVINEQQDQLDDGPNELSHYNLMLCIAVAGRGDEAFAFERKTNTRPPRWRFVLAGCSDGWMKSRACTKKQRRCARITLSKRAVVDRERYCDLDLFLVTGFCLQDESGAVSVPFDLPSGFAT